MKDTLFVTLTVTEAVELIADAVLKKLESVKPEHKELGNLRTREEVCQILKISLPTLDGYAKRGIIKKCKVGTRILYSEKEIERVLNLNK